MQTTREAESGRMREARLCGVQMTPEADGKGNPKVRRIAPSYCNKSRQNGRVATAFTNAAAVTPFSAYFASRA